MTISGRTRLFSAVLTVALVAVVGGTGRPAFAAAYDYKPGHPMMVTPNGRACTGSWVVVGASGSFFLTAGHCDFPGLPGQETTAGFVYGTSASFGHFGFVRRNDDRLGCSREPYGGFDAQLIQPRAGLVGSYQIVAAHGVDVGRTVGVLHNDQLRYMSPIGKFGWIGGWTDGVLRGTYTWCNLERVFVADYPAREGDSGGPVFIHDGRGQVWAAGMHVGTIRLAGTTYSAFISIDDLLQRFGASLPVFPSLSATAPPVPRSGGQPLPHLEGGEIIPG
jgi:hypothetical protein